MYVIWRFFIIILIVAQCLNVNWSINGFFFHPVLMITVTVHFDAR